MSAQAAEAAACNAAAQTCEGRKPLQIAERRRMNMTAQKKLKKHMNELIAEVIEEDRNAYIGRYTPIYAHTRYGRNGHQLVCEASRFKTSEQSFQQFMPTIISHAGNAGTL